MQERADELDLYTVVVVLLYLPVKRIGGGWTRAQPGKNALH